MADVTARPTVLALDSSTERLSLAACHDGQAVLAQLPGGPQTSASLLPQAHALLARLGIGWTALDAVAFGCGPGAFTGLRAAAAVAQGLAFGLDRPLLPLDSLMLVAEAASSAPAAAGDVAVVMDARIGEVYAGRYRRMADGWSVVESPALWSPTALAEAWSAAEPAVLTGSGLGLLPPASSLAGWPAWAADETARPAALLALAVQAWARGEGRPAADGLPLYLRDKVALTEAERARRPPGRG
jgi:tRNA threonylcarbamoyladenosine biosynthesis protein TsaB